jgi:hypothetical protein
LFIYGRHKGSTEMMKSIKRIGTDSMALVTGLDAGEWEYEIQTDNYAMANGTSEIANGLITEITVRMLRSRV